MNNKVVTLGTAAGGNWKPELSDEELGRLFRQAKEIRDALYAAGYRKEIDLLFAQQ